MEILLFLIGGSLYTGIEMLWRGRTHWTMFLLGGICFVIMGLLNEHKYGWDMPLSRQVFESACIITVLEFMTGCVVNLWLGWHVWDYSDMPLNILGQVCVPFFLIWILLSVIGIVMDDWMRYGFYLFAEKWNPWWNIQKRERPHYKWA